MSGLFISYRRDDSAGHAGRLFDRLRDRYGGKRVFMDVSAISAGSDFVKAIEVAVGNCEVLLAVMGREWTTCRNSAGRRRLDDPQDFVRLEIATALRRDVKVIPVLVEDAGMPLASDLPEDLQALTRRQAIELRDERWDADVDHLIRALDRIFEGSGGRRPRRMLSRVAIPAALLLAIAAVLVIYRQELLDRWGKREVPTVTGLALGAANERLIEAGLQAGEAKPQRTDAAPPEQVIAQKPEGGERVKRGTAVELVYAVPLPQRMPLLAGRELDEAKSLLAAQGIPIGAITRRAASDVPAGQVLEQTPAADTELAPGAKPTVDLVVSETPERPEEEPAPDTPEVPPITAPETAPTVAVVGMSLAGAADALRAAGFEPGTVTREPSSGTPDRVLRQSPAAGEPAKPGSRIDLVVAIAEPPPADTRIAVPNLVGLELQASLERLRVAGLRPEPRAADYREGRAKNTVLGTRPRAGEKLERGAKVTVLYNPAPPGVDVPELRRLTLDLARDALTRAGLELGNVERRAVENVPAGTIIEQSPRAGAEPMPRGSRVDIVLAARPVRPQSEVRTSGMLRVPLGSGLDLDEGKVGRGDESDLTYKRVGGLGPYSAGTTQLLAVNGAGFAPPGPTSRERCNAASYNAIARPTQELIDQNFCVRTNGGRMAAVRVEGYVSGNDQNLNISYTTWE